MIAPGLRHGGFVTIVGSQIGELLMRHTLGLVIALATCGCFVALPLSAKAPAPPEPVPSEAVKAVKGVLPKGWTATVKGVTLTIQREKKVGLYNPIGQPFNNFEKPPVPLVTEPYEITLQFRPRVTVETYEKLLKENKATTEKLDAMRDGLRKAQITHKFDDWLPSTPEQTKSVADYRAAQKAMPYHRLPDLYTDTNSIDLSDSVRFPLLFTDPEVAKECEGVQEAIRKLFKSHADQ